MQLARKNTLCLRERRLPGSVLEIAGMEASEVNIETELVNNYYFFPQRLIPFLILKSDFDSRCRVSNISCKEILWRLFLEHRLYFLKADWEFLCYLII